MHQIILKDKDHLDSCHGWCFVKPRFFFQIEYCHQILVKGLRNVDFDSVESYEYGNFFFAKIMAFFLTEFIMEIDCFVKSVILLESKEGLKNWL